MKQLRALLKDRRRSQQGSVLSAVLILVAFLAIISGALTTALSTNFLLSSDLVNRVNTEATVSSAVELGINQLQNTPLNAVCPGAVATPTLNGQTAVASLASCEAVIDRRSPKSLLPVASSEPFNVGGTHAQGLNDYVVGDSRGNVFDYRFGGSAPRWTLALGGGVTAPPAVMPDPSDPGQYLDLIPVSGPACSPASSCISVRSDPGSSTPPPLQCTQATSATFQSQPAAGRNFSNIAYAGDSSGVLYAIDATSSGTCDAESQASLGDPVVAGPLVFPCQSSCGGKASDEVLIVTSNATSSHVLTYSYAAPQGFKAVGNLLLPWPGASGIALDSNVLPSRLAITFSSGRVAMVQVGANADPTLGANVVLPTGISAAPYWCHCPGSINLIGVGGANGTLYVVDSSLVTYATYAGSRAIRTAPAADAMGDWYFGADDGQLYEVAKQNGPTMTLVAQYGAAAGPIGSSPVIGGCPVGICAYLGSLDGNVYLVSLDARAAVLTSCVSTAPPTCSGANPRLWTSVEVGVSGNPRTVHVEGWSYYSP